MTLCGDEATRRQGKRIYSLRLIIGFNNPSGLLPRQAFGQRATSPYTGEAKIRRRGAAKFTLLRRGVK